MIKGWSVTGKTATYNDGTLEGLYVHGKKISEQWTYRATVTLEPNGLTVEVEDDDDKRGMAHGGSTTSLTIPIDILERLRPPDPA